LFANCETKSQSVMQLMLNAVADTLRLGILTNIGSEMFKVE